LSNALWGGHRQSSPPSWTFVVRNRSGRATPRGLLVVGGEVPLARAADGTKPGFRNIVERRARRDAAVRIAFFRVVDEPARFTNPFHGPKCSGSLLLDRVPSTAIAVGS